MPSRSLDTLRPGMKRLAEKFLGECFTRGLDVLVVCTMRTNEEQDALYAQGRTAPGRIVTKARGGQSPHNHGLAFDAYPLIHGKLCIAYAEGDEVSDPIWQTFGQCAAAVGLEWGGSWGDGPHCQHPDWKKIAGVE